MANFEYADKHFGDEIEITALIDAEIDREPAGIKDREDDDHMIEYICVGDVHPPTVSSSEDSGSGAYRQHLTHVAEQLDLVTNGERRPRSGLRGDEHPAEPRDVEAARRLGDPAIRAARLSPTEALQRTWRLSEV
jgi:hypothetical protein